MSSVKLRPFCLGLSVLTEAPYHKMDWDQHVVNVDYLVHNNTWQNKRFCSAEKVTDLELVGNQPNISGAE